MMASFFGLLSSVGGGGVVLSALVSRTGKGLFALLPLLALFGSGYFLGLHVERKAHLEAKFEEQSARLEAAYQQQKGQVSRLQKLLAEQRQELKVRTSDAEELANHVSTDTLCHLGLPVMRVLNRRRQPANGLPAAD